jgi:DNA-binding transcriptional LysR family regulator
VTLDDLRAHDWIWRSYPVPEELAGLGERRVTAIADNIDAATVLILSGSHIGYLPAHHAEPFEQRGLIRVLGRTAFSFDVPLHLAMKRGMADKPIVRAFCEDLSGVYGTRAGEREACPDEPEYAVEL